MFMDREFEDFVDIKEEVKEAENFESGKFKYDENKEAEFGSVSVNQSHQNVKYGDGYIFDGIVCSFCKQNIERSNIREHTITHVRVSSFTCETCGKSFPESNKLKLHMRTHTGEKPYQCENCDKTFATKGSMVGHNRAMHLKENIYQCDQCEHICSTKRGLLGHKSSAHTGDVYKCEICNSILVTEDGFRKHTESKQCLKHSCNQCGKGFSSKSNLGQHMNTHRSETEKVYNFNCEKCGKCFTSKQGLTDHDRIHENIKPYPCDICGKLFRKQGGLRAHKNTVHVERSQTDWPQTYV